MPAPSRSGASVEIEIRGGDHLARIAAALNEVGRYDLRRKMIRDLRRAAAPMVPRVREAIRNIPSKHDGTLRAEMAKATRLQIRSTGSLAGMAIRVDGRRMPPGKGSLPAYLEGRKRPFRHPVFGHEDVWVSQPIHQYFYKTVEPMAAATRVQMSITAAEIAREVTL